MEFFWINAVGRLENASWGTIFIQPIQFIGPAFTFQPNECCQYLIEIWLFRKNFNLIFIRFHCIARSFFPQPKVLFPFIYLFSVNIAEFALACLLFWLLSSFFVFSKILFCINLLFIKLTGKYK